MKKIISFTIALMVTLLSAVTIPTIAKKSQKINAVTVVNDGVTYSSNRTSYSVMDNYCYHLEKPFDESPDSFEAWIKVPSSSLGGTIMGNLTYSTVNFSGTVSWLVDAIGRIKLNWDNGNFVYTFKNAYINDGQWHHVAVIRNAQEHKFSLYVDATLKDSIISNQDDASNARMSMCIGTGYETFLNSKEPFEGYIRQVTVYSTAIDQTRISSDMRQTNISDDNNGTLMGNWYFGETWNSRTVKDTSPLSNDASLWTYDKYVGADYGDFEYDYSFICIPDVQTCSRYHYDTFQNMMNWIVNNKDKEKIAFVWQTGDLADVGGTESFYQKTAEAMSVLDNKVSYSFVQGNHDYDDNSATRSSTYFNKWFPYSKHQGLIGFGGVYEEGTMANSYYLHEVAGIKYCVINLELGPRPSVIRWAGRICEKYPNHRVIINTHAYMGQDGNFMTLATHSEDATKFGLKAYGGACSGQEIFDGLVSRYPNVFMATSGHVPHDNIVSRTDLGVNGNKIISMLVDGQTALHDNGVGEDMMLIMRVNESTKTIRAYYYSPANNGCYNIQNQFEYSFADVNNPTIGK